MPIGLKEICKQYGYGSVHIRTLLCRPEFNQFRVPASSYYVFDDSKNFHKVLKYTIDMKKNKFSNRMIMPIICVFFVLFMSTSSALSNQYEPVIIYNQYGEPQAMLKGRIIYDNYGFSKANLQTKRSVLGLRKK